MPSQRYTNQTVLFNLTLHESWFPIGASGSFLLPYLRELALHNPNIDLRNSITSPTKLERDGFYIWEGELSVEYTQRTTSDMTPERIEWSGRVRRATLQDVAAYLSPANTAIGPVGPNIPPRPTPSA